MLSEPSTEQALRFKQNKIILFKNAKSLETNSVTGKVLALLGTIILTELISERIANLNLPDAPDWMTFFLKKKKKAAV